MSHWFFSRERRVEKHAVLARRVGCPKLFFLTWIFSSFTFGKLCYCHQNRVLYQHLFSLLLLDFFLLLQVI